ncbi:hypothetical protein J6590_039484 [Homalodisca vitripennis]|nr:hypothetical protein J6590_084144 [Homalodisca vitripennis]KAG8257935.1 hypothetical protein J6590_039484 [Homalodisca vitripennis]
MPHFLIHYSTLTTLYARADPSSSYTGHGISWNIQKSQEEIEVAAPLEAAGSVEKKKKATAPAERRVQGPAMLPRRFQCCQPGYDLFATLVRLASLSLINYSHSLFASLVGFSCADDRMYNSSLRGGENEADNWVNFRGKPLQLKTPEHEYLRPEANCFTQTRLIARSATLRHDCAMPVLSTTRRRGWGNGVTFSDVVWLLPYRAPVAREIVARALSRLACFEMKDKTCNTRIGVNNEITKGYWTDGRTDNPSRPDTGWCNLEEKRTPDRMFKPVQFSCAMGSIGGKIVASFSSLFYVAT